MAIQIPTMVKCCVDIPKDIQDPQRLQIQGLYTSAVLWRGIGERMVEELTVLAPSRSKVVALPERKYLVWIGGPFLRILSTPQQRRISKVEHEGSGPTIVHQGCCRRDLFADAVPSEPARETEPV